MQELDSGKKAVAQLVQVIGNKIIMATPLGVGKPNHFLNHLYEYAKTHPEIELTLLTALTLLVPSGTSLLEKNFLKPMTDRVFGDHPPLFFEQDRLAGKLPKNVKVVEFYFQAGKYKNIPQAQQDYLSSNYTHVVRDLVHYGVNAICQQVVAGEIQDEKVFSLSCNPDLTVDLNDLCEKQKKPLFKIAQINPDLPFMYGESVVAAHFFDIVIDNSREYFPVFSPPKMAVSDADYMIGLHASALIKDDGEIQIGIGSLGDAIVYGLCLRQNHNALYRQVLDDCQIDAKSFPILQDWGDRGLFSKGLFAATEMLVDSFIELYKCKILKKKVYDSVVLQRLLNEGKITENFSSDILDLLIEEKAIHGVLSQNDFTFLKEFGILKKDCLWRDQHLILPSGESIVPDLKNEPTRTLIQTQALGDHLRNGAVAHSGFFLGPRSFYEFLKKLPVSERKLFRMKRISQINQLYGHEEMDRLQRTNGRFVNTCMKVSLNGAASSDALANGQQVSGVGGQYNFVAMAQELPDARSILQLRSFRINGQGKPESNIVFQYANCTIPRHLRDVVITEYGIADLRGKTDCEVAKELIQIADSRFQKQLIQEAIQAQKLPENFILAPRFQNNLPELYQVRLKEYRLQKHFPSFPFGTDLTTDEIVLGKALKKLKQTSRRPLAILRLTVRALVAKSANSDERRLLDRLQLIKSTSWKHWIFKKLVIQSLRH